MGIKVFFNAKRIQGMIHDLLLKPAKIEVSGQIMGYPSLAFLALKNTVRHACYG
jgi:hypothetical protein